MQQGPPRQFLLNTTGDHKFDNWGVPVHSFEELTDWAYRSNQFHLRWDVPPRSPLVVDAVAMLALDRGREAGEILIAIDEIQFYLKKTGPPIPTSFQDACLVGRHSNVYMIATSQRSALVHNDFLSQAQRWYIFKTVLRDDLDCVKHLIPGVIERAQRLEVGEYVTYPEQN